MAVILSELERTHAFDRKVLVIIPTTGTGWVDPVAARAIETMYNGDTALVGVQYAICRAGFRSSATSSGRWTSAADGRYHPRPVGAAAPDRRPKLVLYGESLGSMAGQGAFGYFRISLGWVSTPCCGWVRPMRAHCGTHWNTARSGQSAGAAALRQRPYRAVRQRPRYRADRGATAGRARGCCSCSTRRIRSSGGRRICCSTSRIG